MLTIPSDEGHASRSHISKLHRVSEAEVHVLLRRHGLVIPRMHASFVSTEITAAPCSIDNLI
jgi:hypothetical protein